MATGGGAAYQRLTVPQDAISENARHFGGIAAQNMRQMRALNAEKQVRQEEADKEISEKYQIDPSKYNITDAGYDDENQANIALSREIVQRDTAMMREAKELAMAGKTDEAQVLYDEVKMNQLSFKNEQELSATQKANFDFMVTNADKLSGYAKGFENFYEAGSGLGKIIKTLNDKGEIIHMAELVDEDGNKQRQVVSSKDIKNGNWRAYMRQDLDADVKAMTANLGKIKKDKYDKGGYYKTTSQEWDEGATDGSGIHTKAATEAINAKLGDTEYMSDMVDQFDLYKELGIDENNPEINRKFTSTERDIVKEKILEQVKAAYDETVTKAFNASKYASDTRPKKVDKNKDPALSRLNFDADQFVVGDYTGLLGRHETEFGSTINIREVILSPDENYVVAVTDDGEEIEIPNTKRGFLEFKIRSKPEYKGLTPEKVMDNESTKYRESTIGGAEVSAIAKSMFDEEGKPKYDDEKFLQKLKDNFDIIGEDTNSGFFDSFWDIRENQLMINGKKVNIKNKTTFENSLKVALEGKEKIKW